MKQYRITTADNMPTTQEDDCVLDPNDPIHEIMAGLRAEKGPTLKIFPQPKRDSDDS